MGYNYRPTEITSALGIEQLKKIDNIIEKRGKIVEYYIKNLIKLEEIEIPFKDFSGQSAYHIFPILVANEKIRNLLIKYLNNARIQTSYHYFPIHKFSFYKKLLGRKSLKLPITEEFSRREITLPLYQGMVNKDVDFIINTIKQFFHKYNNGLLR